MSDRLNPDDLFPPDVALELERQHHVETVERIRKRVAIRHALWLERFAIDTRTPKEEA